MKYKILIPYVLSFVIETLKLNDLLIQFISKTYTLKFTLFYDIIQDDMTMTQTL